MPYGPGTYGTKKGRPKKKSGPLKREKLTKPSLGHKIHSALVKTSNWIAKNPLPRKDERLKWIKDNLKQLKKDRFKSIQKQKQKKKKKKG